MRPISHSLVRCDQVVSCYLIMVVYHLHFLDRSKVFRYIGFAQQAYRELTQSKTASTGWRPVDVFENTFCLVVFFVLFCFVLFLLLDFVVCLRTKLFFLPNAISSTTQSVSARMLLPIINTTYTDTSHVVASYETENMYL